MTKGKRSAEPSDSCARAVGTIVSNLSGSQSNHKLPSVSCNENGAEFLVAWEGEFSFTRGVLAAFVETDGASQGTFDVWHSQGAPISFTKPDVAFGAHGKALIIWEDDPTDGTSQDIAGRLVGGRLFVDGFESGHRGYWEDN